MLDAYLPLLITIVAAAGLAGLVGFLGFVLGPRRPSAIKLEAFECGNPASGDARERFNVKFYLVGILFLIFDVEAVFIYPWAVTFHDAIINTGGVEILGLASAMASFAGVIVVALIYAWRKGALDWSTSA